MTVIGIFCLRVVASSDVGNNDSNNDDPISLPDGSKRKRAVEVDDESNSEDSVQLMKKKAKAAARTGGKKSGGDKGGKKLAGNSWRHQRGALRRLLRQEGLGKLQRVVRSQWGVQEAARSLPCRRARSWQVGGRSTCKALSTVYIQVRTLSVHPYVDKVFRPGYPIVDIYQYLKEI